MQQGVSPIYEEGLSELMNKNRDRLTYTTDYKAAYADKDVIIIGVGTPEKKDGSANLSYVYAVAEQIAHSVTRDCPHRNKRQGGSAVKCQKRLIHTHPCGL